jgi:hypothetical protein
MNMHKNALLTPLGRERIVRQVESGQTPEAVSEARITLNPLTNSMPNQARRRAKSKCRADNMKKLKVKNPAAPAVARGAEE